MSTLISVDEAIRLLVAHAITFHARTVPLEDALGAHLAKPVIAKVSRPQAAVSAMDGYAVRLADVRTRGAVLDVIGDAPAGRPFPRGLRKGEALRLFTGSNIPQGADHVVIQEEADRQGNKLVCRNAYELSEYIRPAGLDFSAGEELLRQDMRVSPAALSIAAAANHGTLSIFPRPRVGILANGDELRNPGSDLGPGQIVNSNPAGLGALILQWGGEPVDLGVADDSLESIRAHIDAASDIDIFLPVGGASVGDHDLMRPAFADAGFVPVFQKIAVKPGKPTWFSTKGSQRVLGLPGNPASAFVCAYLFLRPLIDNNSHHGLVKARTKTPLPGPGARETFLRATASVCEEGMLIANVASNQDSSLIKPLLESNALIRRSAGTKAAAIGDLVDVLMIGPL